MPSAKPNRAAAEDARQCFECDGPATPHRYVSINGDYWCACDECADAYGRRETLDPFAARDAWLDLPAYLRGDPELAA